MTNIRIEYHHGSSVELNTDEIKRYHVRPGKAGGQDQIVPDQGKPGCSWEYVIESVIHHRPLVLRNSHDGDFGRVISMEGVREIINLENKAKEKP
jgi:hypothetical protein